VLNNVFRISWLLWDNLNKYSRLEQATDNYMVHANCMMNT